MMLQQSSGIRSASPSSIGAPATPGAVGATIAALDGRFVTGGMATISGRRDSWRATVRQLDRPGVMATMYFAEGTRDVVLRLADGRRARARIAGTSFNADRQRVCELSGIEPLV